VAKTFEEVAYLSPEMEPFREAAREVHCAEFARLESSFQTALGDLRSMNNATGEAYLVGLGYWIRCIEAGQAVVLLAERGMAAVPFAALRTAYECLFYASALWRQPALTVKFELLHHQERIKQARAMLKAGANVRLPADRLAALKAIAAETAPSEAGITVWEAAGAADLSYEYEAVYRGCGLAGAHGSIRSLDSFYTNQQDGCISLRLEPDTTSVSFLLGLVTACLQCGILRRREAHAKFSSHAGELD